jgi:hypothetical protein
MARKTKAKRARAKRRKQPKTTRRRTLRRIEADLEEGLRETFPGSDAVAVIEPTRPGNKRRK